jgi:integration host factor subunit alpha
MITAKLASQLTASEGCRIICTGTQAGHRACRFWQRDGPGAGSWLRGIDDAWKPSQFDGNRHLALLIEDRVDAVASTSVAANLSTACRRASRPASPARLRRASLPVSRGFPRHLLFVDEPFRSFYRLRMKAVTRAHLAERLYAEVGLSRNESAGLVDDVLERMASVLEIGEALKVTGFGTFTVRQKGHRIGRNPKTGVETPILPRRVIVFRPSNVLKAHVNHATPPDRGEDDE